MKIKINNIDELLQFVQRNDVSVKDALKVFNDCVDVICVVLTDAVTGEAFVKKSQIIDEVKNIKNGLAENKNFTPKTILFL